MLLRLLFLASLILAFAQPFFSRGKQKDTGNRLQVIYIDNSYSMSVKKGARNLLDIAKEAAQRQIREANAGTRFILLTNDKPLSYQPLPADKTAAAINTIDISPGDKNLKQILSSVQSLMQSETAIGADLYYYSDFQKSSFSAAPDAELLKQIHFHGVPVQADEVQNIYIDTAYLNTPVLQTGQSNQIIVRTRTMGKPPKETPILQLAVNGQVKSAATLSFNDKNESIDTLSFQPNDASWQHVILSLNDAAVKFDDTFRITARSAPNLSILVLNERQANPYIQAAFKAYNGFRLNQFDVNNSPTDWKDYNLVIINGVTAISSTLGKQMNTALETGESICIFPGKTDNYEHLNEGLKEAADITITGLDTASQITTNLQQGSDLVRDMFERIPENVQLPTAGWHYIINSGLSANGQSILSFRNGDPFLINYRPAKGQLYMCATGVDIGSGNFAGSYFFAPFLYQMAMQSHASDIYALTDGRKQAAYLPLNKASERDMVHLYGPGTDIIPPQRPEGAGTDVYVDEAVQQPGFYTLAGKSGDTTDIALNADRNESELDTWDIGSLRQQWKGDAINWVNIKDLGAVARDSGEDGFPLWKVCVILALVMLTTETALLAGRFKKQTVATE